MSSNCKQLVAELLRKGSREDAWKNGELFPNPKAVELCKELNENNDRFSTLKWEDYKMKNQQNGQTMPDFFAGGRRRKNRKSSRKKRKSLRRKSSRRKSSKR